MTKELHPVDTQTTLVEFEDVALSVDENARPACLKSTLQEVLLVLSATMAVAMGTAQQGTVIVITSFMARDLKMSTVQISWIYASASLASGASLLLFGRVADLFGRKPLFIISMFLFALTCIAAGFSTNGVTLDILSGLLGLFSASAVPPAQGILGVIYSKPSKRKNTAMSCFSAGNPLGFAFGMVFSGIATQLFNWRAGFWLLAIEYFVISLVALWAVPPETFEKAKLDMEALRKFDLFGTLLTTAGVGMFTGAISLASDAPRGWHTPYILALLIIGILLMVAFVFWEIHYEYPLVPMTIWKDRNLSLLIIILALGFLAFSESYFWLSLYLQRVWKANAIRTALFLLPQAVMGLIINVIAAATLHRVSNKLLMGIGALSYTIAFVLEGVHKTSISYWSLFFPALCLTVIGADLQFNVANLYIMSTLPPDQQSIAGGIMQTVTKLCTTVAFGFSTAIFKAVEHSSASDGYYGSDPVRPYAATWWCSAAIAALSCGFVPFLTLRTQGGGKEDRREDERVKECASDGVSFDEEGRVEVTVVTPQKGSG